jgi:predicted RNase H-like HicB family nuclease
MKAKTVKVLIDWDENYGAVSEAMPGCVATDKTVEGVEKAYASALEFHLDGMRKDGDNIPDIFKGTYQLEFELSAQALLHRFDGILTRAALSRITGINEKLLGHYMSGYRTPRPARRQKIVEGMHKVGHELLEIT